MFLIGRWGYSTSLAQGGGGELLLLGLYRVCVYISAMAVEAGLLGLDSQGYTFLDVYFQTFWSSFFSGILSLGLSPSSLRWLLVFDGIWLLDSGAFLGVSGGGILL